jgi:hypothetical protein
VTLLPDFRSLYILVEPRVPHHSRNVSDSDPHSLTHMIASRGAQRIALKAGKLATERVDRLLSIGFKFEHWSARWSLMLAALKDYTDSKKGQRPGFSSKLVHMYAGKEVKLGRWVDKQRLKYRKGELSEEEVHANPSFKPIVR